mgnify:CR=1 FL=1
MEVFFRIVFILLFSLLSVMRWFFKLKYHVYKGGVFTKNEGAVFTAARIVLGLPLIAAVILYTFFPDLQPWMYVSIHPGIRICSTLAASASLILLYWIHKTLKDNFSTNLRMRKTANLITEGPYHFIRHPMYSAYFVLMLSAFGISRNFFIGIFGVSIILLLMTFRRRKEEMQLIERYGDDYKYYKNNTPAFFPKLFQN